MPRQNPSAGQIARLRTTVQRLDAAVKGANFDGPPIDPAVVAGLTVDALLAILVTLENLEQCVRTIEAEQRYLGRRG